MTKRKKDKFVYANKMVYFIIVSIIISFASNALFWWNLIWLKWMSVDAIRYSARMICWFQWHSHTHTQPANLFQLNLAYIRPLSRLFRSDALPICVSYTVRYYQAKAKLFFALSRTCVMDSTVFVVRALCIGDFLRCAVLISLSVPFHRLHIYICEQQQKH